MADAFAVLGLLLLAAGQALVSVPLMLCALGTLLLAGGLLSHFRRPQEEYPHGPVGR